MSAEAVLREFLDWYDARFPTDQAKQFPGVSLFGIAEKAREALEPYPGDKQEVASTPN